MDTYHSKYDENGDVDGDEAMATIWERDRYSMHKTVTTSTGEHTGQPGNSQQPNRHTLYTIIIIELHMQRIHHPYRKKEHDAVPGIWNTNIHMSLLAHHMMRLHICILHDSMSEFCRCNAIGCC